MALALASLFTFPIHVPVLLCTQTINYQYRNGTTMSVALKTLYKEGGIPRFYQGLLPALVQGPASRFGDTAANAGVITLLDSLDSTKDLPVLGAWAWAWAWSGALWVRDTDGLDSR